MRFLNKIIFINSGSVKYAEIELDGNVHFIGTQGVGKSTLLRAILFFYNADKIKLGIPREKKRFDEYYFEFQNSYIIYEVIKDRVPYCVLAYKQNGRVAYRFFNAAYQKELFINQQGRAFESWEQIRKGFGKKIYYTKLVSSYDEFRKIIYGDNKSLKPEFRKYAILESKQFQNIPRTIQNVLLNTKLEAQFIKETIIKSLDEEEITIDLSNYSKSHLRDFETELNDIRIWFKENRKGKIIIKKQAETAIENYRIVSFLKHDKRELAKTLAQRIRFVASQKPLTLAGLHRERSIFENLGEQIAKLKKLHHQREIKNSSKINLVKNYISEANKKQKEYQTQHIAAVVQRVAEKKNLQSEKANLQKERALLTAKFTELTQKFESLFIQLKNQEKEFENQKEAEKNSKNKEYTELKEQLYNEYQLLIKQIEKDNNERVERAQNKVEAFKEETNRIKLQKEGLKHKVYYKNERDQITKEIADLERSKNKSITTAFQARKEIESLKKEGGFEEKEIQRQYLSHVSTLTTKRTEFTNELTKIKAKVHRHKDSLYAWLNENYANWENTIGKVVDEEAVLFNTDLQPELAEKQNTTLFGLNINVDAIPQRVKTIDDYNADIKALQGQIERCDKDLSLLTENNNKALKSLKIKFNKKINPLKDTVSKMEYQASQAATKLKKHSTDFTDIEQKAVTDKQKALNELENQLNGLANKKSMAEKELAKIEESIKRQKSAKHNEHKRKISEQKKTLETTFEIINKQIAAKQSTIEERKVEIKRQQNGEMSAKGADTQRLERLEKQLEELEQELTYIEQHQTLVIEYHKDKRELFDKVAEWKNQQTSLEYKQEAMLENQRIETEKLQKKHNSQKEEVDALQQQIKQFETEVDAFEAFKKTEVFSGIEGVFDYADDDLTAETNHKTDHKQSAVHTIDQIKDTHYKSIEKFRELQKALTAFVGNFNENNIFSFKTKFLSDKDFLNFANELKEFIDEDKITQYEKRVNERFVDIIHLIGKETNELISKEAEIEKIIKKINDDFRAKNFVGAIRSMEMRTQSSSNKIVKLLLEIKTFNDENSLALGAASLFSSPDRSSKNQKAVELLKQLVHELENYKSEVLTLSESFDLQFRIVENDNDSGWVEKLSNVGSEGTDILVKAMINILLLNVFKESASKKFKDFKLHCMMDEVGRLHPTNVKGILKFANDRNILLINGSPTSYNAIDYRYTYILSNALNGASKKHITKIRRLVKATPKTLQQ